MTDFARTRAAIAAWDAGARARYECWLAVSTKEELRAAMAREKEEADLVREAFAEDTAHVNSRDNAFLVHPDDPWLRRVVGAPERKFPP